MTSCRFRFDLFIGAAALAWVVAILLAGALTLVDVANVFQNIPAGCRKRVYAWIGLFVVANIGLAALALLTVRSSGDFTDWNQIALGAIVGLGYQALLRSQFTTVASQDGQVPIGFEYIYSSARRAILTRINIVVRSHKAAKTVDYAKTKSLVELATNAIIIITNDSLKTDEEKLTDSDWVVRTRDDLASVEGQRKAALASFVLFGSRLPSDDVDR